MALKAFHDNPCIGGFGGESTVSIGILIPDSKDEDLVQNGDALCQIVKELVDNAMDACKPKGRNQRVKVEIFPYEHDNKILKIQVSDTGVGMSSIQDCVDAFQSNKGRLQSKTAGRYGVGLTLCMLHAQRLVSNSYCCITSATEKKEHYTRAFYVVDTNGDSVVCQKQERFRKPSHNESGTCVTVLVPGGVTAALAWTRLENYFVRFRLRDGGPDLEILAPALSEAPIFVRARPVVASECVRFLSVCDEEYYEDALEDCLEDGDTVNNSKPPAPLTAAQQRLEPRRKAAFVAGQSFLGYHLKLENVARSVQTIRMNTSRSNEALEPSLEVDIFVCPDAPTPSKSREEPVAIMKLIRMVNDVPLLDGAEGCACGLVHGLANKLVWGSFGLHVTQSSDSDKNSWTPLFDIGDSGQVAPFFQQHQHGLWTGGSNEAPNRGNNEKERKRKHKSLSNGFFPPAKARLGEVTVVIKIQASPSCLSLPTLSKGRLPLNNGSIDSALQLGLRDCLRSLQRTNPQLLLAPTQLRAAIREIRYIPAMALAVSQIVSRSSDIEGQDTVLDVISAWKNRKQGYSLQQNYSLRPQSRRHRESSIRSLTIRQLKQMIVGKERAIAEAKRKKPRKQHGVVEKEYGDLDGSDAEDEYNNTCLTSSDRDSESNRPPLEIEPATASIDSTGSSPILQSKKGRREGAARPLDNGDDATMDRKENDENDNDWW